jgi:Ca2+-binding EF-hand superfamily protein
MIQQVDEDSRGEVEFPEFCEIMASREKDGAVVQSQWVAPKNKKHKTSKTKNAMTANRVAETKQVFDSFDVDGNGL